MPLPESMNLAVLGQGSTGLAVASWAAAHLGGAVSGVTVIGGAASEPTAKTREVEAAGVRFAYGTEEVDGSYDVCVASPGISEFSDFFAHGRAHATEIMGEPELAWRLSPERWIAITGTNGKTTTTALTDYLLNGAGMTSVAVGNIGDCIISCVDSRPAGSWFTAELSSYQLATTREFHPRVGMLLNITPDHLSWHRTHEAYAYAKCRMFQNMGEGDLAIVNVSDEGVRSVLDHIVAPGRRVLSLSLTDVATDADAAFVRDGSLCVRLAGAEHVLVCADELKIAGDHNVLNALAASAAALFVGADPDAVRRGLKGFSPLEHRIEPAGEVDGVRFYNDSKATNTDAVEKALTAFPSDRVVLLVGGHDKGTPLEGFVSAVASSSVEAVVCFGEARDRFVRAFVEAEGTETIDIAEADNLRDAVDVARTLAHAGDVILLSPACSSFDEFSGFEERGRVFKAYVEELRGSLDGRR